MFKTVILIIFFAVQLSNCEEFSSQYTSNFTNDVGDVRLAYPLFQKYTAPIDLELYCPQNFDIIVMNETSVILLLDREYFRWNCSIIHSRKLFKCKINQGEIIAMIQVYILNALNPPYSGQVAYNCSFRFSKGEDILSTRIVSLSNKFEASS